MQIVEQSTEAGTSENISPAGHSLKIAILSDNMKFSGGRVVLFGYGEYLKSRGHDVEILTLSRDGRLSETHGCRQVRGFTRSQLPPSDLLIASVPQVVRDAVRSRCAPVVHFCQGFPIADLEQRLKEGIVPVRNRGTTAKSALGMWWKRLTWRRKLHRLNRIYRMPASLVTISPHLQRILHERYGKPVALCENGINRTVFYPEKRSPVEQFTHQRPCRVVCVGSWEITFKGIAETTSAVKMVKTKGLPVEFVRISATPCHPAEAEARVFDTFHESLTPAQIASVFRGSDIYISNSLEAEGFGLPAMEAMSCGLASILSDIPSYRGFAERRDFCRFVPQANPSATAAALESLITGPAHARTKLHENAIEIAADYSLEKANARFDEIVRMIAAS